MTHGPREQRRWRGICAACAWQMRQRPAGRRPASGQCLKHHIQLLMCKRVLPCESMGVAGEARARVLRACRVRGGRVCWCASAEQARGRRGGEGRDRSKPSARTFLSGCTEFCAPRPDSGLSKKIVTSFFLRMFCSFFSSKLRLRSLLAPLSSAPQRIPRTLPRVYVVACARRKPHHQNSLQSS